MAVSHRATGTTIFSAATMVPGVPAAQVTGDMMLLLVGGKPYNSAVTATWTAIGSAYTDGTTAAGVDTGSMFVRAYYNIATSDAEADPTVTEGSPAWDVVGAVVMVFQKAANELWLPPVIVGGGDASAGTGFSVTGEANPGVFDSDMTVSFAAFRSDAATPCTSHLVATQTGVTFSNTHDPGTDPETMTGGDMGMCINRGAVTAGAGTAAPVMAATIAASHTGSAAFIRIRARPIQQSFVERYQSVLAQ